MHTQTATLLLALSAALALNSASAEPFNDRGEDIHPPVRVGTVAAAQDVAPELAGFTDRGVDVIATAPASTEGARATVRPTAESMCTVVCALG